MPPRASKPSSQIPEMAQVCTRQCPNRLGQRSELRILASCPRWAEHSTGFTKLRSKEVDLGRSFQEFCGKLCALAKLIYPRLLDMLDVLFFVVAFTFVMAVLLWRFIGWFRYRGLLTFRRKVGPSYWGVYTQGPCEDPAFRSTIALPKPAVSGVETPSPNRGARR